MIKHLFALTLLSLSSISNAWLYGNGAWAYDSTYSADGKKIKNGDIPGLFAEDNLNLNNNYSINGYNRLALDGHKITQVFTYGSDLELFCEGSGGTDLTVSCNQSNMYVFYDSQSTGRQSSLAYAQQTQAANNPVVIIPVVDGRLDQMGEDDYLGAMNYLTKKKASLLADKVARAFCADPLVGGIQFDIEPFNLTFPGQKYFYQQIAKDLAGANANIKCVDNAHPNGRFFSVFTNATSVTPLVANILNSYQNGYVIDSLYDLGPNDGGIASAPTVYRNYVKNEIARMVKVAKTYGVHYQFAIPAGASVHEFEQKGQVSTGFCQLDYVQAAIEEIKKAPNNPKLFLGTDVWAWHQRMIWAGVEFLPTVPTSQNADAGVYCINGDDVLGYLRNNL